MLEFYHDLITEKSYKILQSLRLKFDFILIGGWAIYLYTKALKSKDVDIIVDYSELAKLKNNFQIFKNERLRKYEIKFEEVDVDIYLPFFSELGLPLEEIKNYAMSVEGFKVLSPAALLILKIKTYSDRKGTNKGEKDLIDIFSLLLSGKIEWSEYKKIIGKYNLKETSQKLKEIIFSVKSIPQLNLSNHRISKLKKKVVENIS